jgi:hypothetical protein
MNTQELDGDRQAKPNEESRPLPERSVLLRVVGWGMVVGAFFPSLFPCAILWLSFRWWFPLAAIIVVGISAFKTGRYCIRVEASPLFPKEKKPWLAALIVSVVYFIGLTTVAISWCVGGEHFDVVVLYVFLYYLLAGALFFAAVASLLRKRVKLATGFLIGAGILSLPVGAIPLVVGLLLRRPAAQIERAMLSQQKVA